MSLTTLGWLKHFGDPAFEYHEYHFLKYLHKTLTEDWYIIQGGKDDTARWKWLNLMGALELDKKAKVDLILLAHSGLPGRTAANKIVWDLCSLWALDPGYENLSHKVSSEVGHARKQFDRPPHEHPDLNWWRWDLYQEPRRNVHFSPLAVPKGPWTLLMGEGSEPLPPPRCWGPPPQHQ